ncbi:MAG: FtsX-like permease family protein [Coriobacteriia bacterium]|nr:FtsX-like permease family protein [Coriobacteriia bacterium]
MYPLWTLAWANIRKTRSASITLTIMFVIAALLLNAGLLVLINYGGFFTELTDELQTSDVIYVMSRSLYSPQTARYFARNPHVTATEDLDCLMLDGYIKPRDIDKNYYLLFFDMDQTRTMSEWKFVGESLGISGVMPIYVPEVFKSIEGYHLGDELIITYRDDLRGKPYATGKDDETELRSELVFTVKGYIEDVYLSSTETGVVGFYLPSETYHALARKLDSPIYQAHVTFADLDDIESFPAVEGDLRDVIGLNSTSLMASPMTSVMAAIDLPMLQLARTMMANMVSAMMVLFALIIVGVCLLVVYFKIVNSIEEEMLNIGSLKSAGYTTRQIITSIGMQFLVLAVAGSTIGIIGSYAILPAVALVLEQQSGLMWEQGFDATISIAVWVVLLLITALVVWFAARHVHKLTPITALRGESHTHTYRKNRLELHRSPLGLSSTLALKSILQNPRQSVMILVIVTAVAFSGAFGVTMFYNSAIDTTAFAQVPGQEITNVIAIANIDRTSPALLNKISKMSEVRKAIFLDEASLTLNGNDVSAEVMVDFSQREASNIYQGHYPEKSGELAVAGLLAEKFGLHIGDSAQVGFDGKEETFTIVGLSSGSFNGNAGNSILAEDYLRFNPDFKTQVINIYLWDSVDTARYITTLKDTFGKDVFLEIMNFDELMEEALVSYQSIISLMGIAMLVITAFVITLVLYFVISSSVIRKRHELGIFKANGYTTEQLMLQFTLECMVPVIAGASLGCVLGGIYTNALVGLAFRSAGMMVTNFIVDPLWVFGFGLITVVFSFMLALLITWRIRNISAYALVTE